MKNPFRTRFAIQSEKMLPDYLELTKGDSIRWVVVYRKWYQRKWYYYELVPTGFGGCKMPRYYKTKEEAVASVTRHTLN